MSITSDEVNYLIYRYLQEAGFTHSAFTFANESLVNKANINSNDVPAGTLITFLQKGLLYKEMETHVTEDGTELECDVAFSLVGSHVCKVKEKKEREIDITDHAEPMDDVTSNNLIAEDQVTVLEGHTSEVFICAWNPVNSLLASGSGDSTSRIWNIPPGPSGPKSASIASKDSIVLRHVNNQDSSKDVTTLDWNGTGTLLATGSYDGLARIWSDKGELKQTLNKHKGPIFSLKWNKRGDYILSGSVDRTAIIWDAASGEVKQQFDFHKAPTLDVDWRNDTSFASCSTDKMIYVCEYGKTRPLKCWQGHTDEVNAIKWDSSGTFLASCSDDFTAKIWGMNASNDKCVCDLKEHTKEIYTIKWSPNGPHTLWDRRHILASASFDASIKIWDVDAGYSMFTLTKHSDPVYSVAWSPNGEFLASGSFDNCLHIWSTKDGSLVRTYKGRGGIFEVCWNNTGDKVAACFANNTVCVVDMRK